MICATAEAMAGAHERFSQNVLIDAFVIHGRCMIEFLYEDQCRHPGDIRAWHYFQEADDWRKTRGEMDAVLRRFKEHADGWLAHLTSARRPKEVEVGAVLCPRSSLRPRGEPPHSCLASWRWSGLPHSGTAAMGPSLVIDTALRY